MTPYTEEQLREIAETLLGETRTHLLQRQGMPAVMMYVAPERVAAVARACLDTMARERAALARAEAAEALLTYARSLLSPSMAPQMCRAIDAHLATVPQQTRKECDPPSEMTTADPLPQPASYSPAPDASVSGAESKERTMGDPCSGYRNNGQRHCAHGFIQTSLCWGADYRPGAPYCQREEWCGVFFEPWGGKPPEVFRSPLLAQTEARDGG